MQADIAIIVVAYNRPQSLNRLLWSLQTADYTGFANIPLIISIDYSGDDKCEAIASRFDWKHGEKKIIAHTQNLGLKNHILQCGDMALRYDGVIVLEDDLFVSPAFYPYAQQAYRFYKDAEAIAGIGLYNYPFNEIAFCPFEPIADGYDNYFMQVPCSWGQLWTKQQWQNFKAYYSAAADFNFHLLPEVVQAWPSATSWKKIFYQYIVERNLYFLYPRISLTTNFGDKGQHHSAETMVWQSALLLRNMNFRFSQIENAISIYDAYFELSAEAYNRFTNQSLDICIDLNGSKPLSKVNNRFLLSSKYCGTPQQKFGMQLYPFEKNVLMNLEPLNNSTNFFSLSHTKDFEQRLGVERRFLDINRSFMNIDFIVDKGRNEIKNSNDYKLGHFLLKPFYFLNNKFKIFNRKPKKNGQ